MLLTITLILVAMVLLAALEIWLFWQLGERDDRRRIRKRREPRSSERWTGRRHVRSQRRSSSPLKHAA
jgi:hypothetical protein